LIQNDFEPGLANIHPEIQHALNQLKAAGAHYAQMTGSGSAVFGLFDSEQQARDVDLDQVHTFVGLATA
jgi:4-diphosphocytidyl-2-C-methyl-D-erythritol kinase